MYSIHLNKKIPHNKSFVKQIYYFQVYLVLAKKIELIQHRKNIFLKLIAEILVTFSILFIQLFYCN